MKKFLFYLCALLCATAASAADHCVTRTGAGAMDGSSWTNAYPATVLNSGTLVRGDVYYVAGDTTTYPAMTLNDPSNGTLTITLRHPKAADTNCGTFPNSGYYNNATVFGPVLLKGDYYVFDGRTQPTPWAKGIGTYGMSISNAARTAAAAVTMSWWNGSATVGSNNQTFKFVDIVGGNRDTGLHDDVLYDEADLSGLTIKNSALHDSDQTLIHFGGSADNVTIDHSFLARQHSSNNNHGEPMSVIQLTNFKLSNSVVLDVEGTAVVAALNGDVKGATVQSYNWNVYNNVFAWTDAYNAGTGRTGVHDWGVQGILYAAVDTTNNNCLRNSEFGQNTIYNGRKSLHTGVVLPSAAGTSDSQCGSTYVNSVHVWNNLWWLSARTSNTPDNGIYAGDGYPGRAYNFLYDTLDDFSILSSDTVCYDSAWGNPYGVGVYCPGGTPANPFFDPSDTGLDFHLTYNIKSGYTGLGAPYTTDQDGNSRTTNWSVGAFAF